MHTLSLVKLLPYIVAISVVPDIELSPIDLENLALIAQQTFEFVLDSVDPTIVGHAEVAIPNHDIIKKLHVDGRQGHQDFARDKSIIIGRIGAA